jgi:hypothetical protein
VGIDWNVINTGCPNCKAKAGGPQGLQYHGLSWWCLRCGASANWEEDKPIPAFHRVGKLKRRPDEETTMSQSFTVFLHVDGSNVYGDLVVTGFASYGSAIEIGDKFADVLRERYPGASVASTVEVASSLKEKTTNDR